MTALPKDVVADLRRRIAELEQQLQSAAAERDEAIAQQAATAEILQIINSSPADLAPVFEAILDKALRPCEAQVGVFWTYDGELMRASAIRGASPAYVEFLQRGPYRPSHVQLRLLGGTEGFVQIADLINSEGYRNGDALPRAAADLGGIRTLLVVPLRRHGAILGTFGIYRQEVKPFTDRQIALVESFAAQAAIAMENARLFNETKEALERQTATADILKVIASSPSDVQPVFQAIAESATRLFGGYRAMVTRRDGDYLHLAAIAGIEEGRDALRRRYPMPLSSPGFHAEAALNRAVRFCVDIETDPSATPEIKEIGRARGFRSFLVVPMLREGVAIGTIGVARPEPGEFSIHQIELLKTFADQAVIAIENARLFNETREALERQTATAEILKVIASSPSNVQPVFEAIAASANRLLRGFSTAVLRFVDDFAHLAAFTPTNPAADEVLRTSFPLPLTDYAPLQLVQNGETVQFADTETAMDFQKKIARARGFRSVLLTPLMSKGTGIGMISVTRVETGSFSDHHVQLLRTFADQAVIAIENVRLFDEVQARTRDLTESLQQQTATAEVLKVISRATFDLPTVLQTLVESAARLCEADKGTIARQKDGEFYRAESFGFSREFMDYVREIPVTLDRGSASGRALLEGVVIHIPDVEKDPDFTFTEAARLGDIRANLGVPMLREGRSVGVFSLTRSEPRPFTDKQIELVTTFADQAVIAIENARLFEEVQAKTRDLTESLQQQTATADVLKVISRSAFDLQPVFDTIVQTASRLCDSEYAIIYGLKDDDKYHVVANNGADPVFLRYAIEHPLAPGRGSLVGRTALERKTVHMPDCLADPEYVALEFQSVGRYRSMIGVPLLREGVPIGVIILMRTVVLPFTEKQIELVTTFADQAVIAIENARLFDEVQAKTHELSEALTYQTGSSNILGVIASSPTDVGPVLKAIVESARELCEADDALVVLKDGNDLVFKEQHGSLPVVWRRLPINRNWATGRTVIDRIPVHVHDLLSAEGEEFPEGREIARRDNVRTILTIPLLREQESIGAIVLRRTEVHPFSDRQIALLQTFADQAVIAIGNVHLFEEVQARTEDLRESLEFQTATSDVLKVISSSPDSLQPVLDVIVTTARHLCGTETSTIFLLKDGRFHIAAASGAMPEYLEFLRANPIALDQAGSSTSRAAREKRTVHIPDIGADPEFGQGPMAVGQRRALLSVPLMREGTAIGVITMRQSHLTPFTERQIEVVQTFADQAVIAISNVRLFEEVQARTRDLTESLQQQTATADVLKVISRSAFDLQAVLDTLVESAAKLCEADMAAITRRTGDVYYRAGSYGFPPEFAKYAKDIPVRPGRSTITGRALLEGGVVHVEDVLADTEYDFEGQQLSGNPRTFLGVPLLREGKPVGAIVLARRTVRPFAEKQIELVRTFADQAVIAIENVRLFDEVQAKTRELTEALTYQTGSSNILSVIASSPTDVAPVLKAIVDSACELCDAYDAAVLLSDGDQLRFCAHHGPIPISFEKLPINRNWTAGRAFVDRKPIHVHDLLAEGDEFPLGQELSQRMGHRSILSVPLLREGESIGTIVLRRTEVHPFSEKQIALLETFADQAVIAIGNVRLFEQVQERTRELSKSLEDLRTAQDRLVQTQKLASLGQLTAGIAHEIKNPLNFVNNFASLSAELTDELNEVLAPATLDDKVRQEVGEITQTLKDNLTKVVQHGKRADSIVKNMLLHSREGSGEHRPVDINALLDESLNLAYHGARAEKPQFNVTLQRDFDQTAGMIEVFPQEITRVFLNLISNGFYAVTKRKMENGGTGFEAVVSATTRSLGDTVEIRIRDNGTGISVEVKEKMFNPFFTTKPAGEGTGLGLSMSHDIIVKQHGGTIDVETEPGHFTEFRIVLPRTSILSKQN
jgi:GAF domain-containing protein